MNIISNEFIHIKTNFPYYHLQRISKRKISITPNPLQQSNYYEWSKSQLNITNNIAGDGNIQ